MKLKISLVLILLIVFTPFVAVKFHRPLVSAPPTAVKDVLDNSQLSYFGRILTATQGQSVITVGYSAPSITSDNLNVGDTVGIGTTGVGVGTSGPLTIYTIRDIGEGNTGTVQLSSGIGQSNAWVGAAIIATRSAIHTFYWTPQSNLTGGFWQFLIKASSMVGEVSNDGIPDQQGFDLGQDIGTSFGLGTRLTPDDVACPNFATGVGSTIAYSIGTTTYNGNSYHVITCALGAGNTNAIGVGYTATIGRALTTGSQLINPAPSQTGHQLGTAETHAFFIRHLNSSSVLDEADTMQGRIAVIESVRVTATVDPTLTFTIDNTNIGSTGCGVLLKSSNANVTSTQVPFGSLSVGDTGNNLAQRLGVITNGTGYVVTAYESMIMRNIATGTTIPNTDCDAGTCTITVSAGWTGPDAAKSEFGYSLQSLQGTPTMAFTSGTNFTSKPFGVAPANAATIFSYVGTPTAYHYAAVCYRIVANSTQEAGNYETEVIYTATATF